ncbi:MAG: rod shape-determining protein MreC [Bacteroidales bacterium]
MVVQNNYQKHTFLNYSSSVTGSAFAAFNNISGYFSLKKANEILVSENTRLKESLASSFLVSDTCSFISNDTLYQFTNAKVISNTISKRKNFIMLNKGTLHGIKKDMGVICPTGLVGTSVVDAFQSIFRGNASH